MTSVLLLVLTMTGALWAHAVAVMAMPSAVIPYAPAAAGAAGANPLWATHGAWNANWCLGNPHCNANTAYWTVRAGTPNAWRDWCTGNSNCDAIPDWCIGNSNCWAGYQSWCAGAPTGTCAAGAHGNAWWTVHQQQVQQQLAAMGQWTAQMMDARAREQAQAHMQAWLGQLQGTRWW